MKTAEASQQLERFLADIDAEPDALPSASKNGLFSFARLRA